MLPLWEHNKLNKLRVISQKRLQEFWRTHASAEQPIRQLKQTMAMPASCKTILTRIRFKKMSMDIKPIKTESDYQAALREIEGLMDAQPDTLEGDRLDIMTTLIKAYEARHNPIDPLDQVEAILHRMEALGIDRKDLEK